MAAEDRIAYGAPRPRLTWKAVTATKVSEPSSATAYWRRGDIDLVREEVIVMRRPCVKWSSVGRRVSGAAAPVRAR